MPGTGEGFGAGTKTLGNAEGKKAEERQESNMPAGNLTLEALVSSEPLKIYPPEVSLFVDFDGTITSVAGESTVYSVFYQSLLQGYVEGVKQHYKKPEFKDPKEVQDLIHKTLGPYNPQALHSPFLMGTEAVRFLHAMLCTPYVRVNIVTKNRISYIKHLFLYQGFSDNEINSLNIIDRFQSKGSVVRQTFTKPLTPEQSIFIFDDNLEDYNSMLAAAQLLNREGRALVKAFHRPSGQFEWSYYLEEIRKRLPRDPLTFGSPETYRSHPGQLFLRFSNPQDQIQAVLRMEQLGISNNKDLSQKLPAYKTSELFLTVEINREASFLIDHARTQAIAAMYAPVQEQPGEPLPQESAGSRESTGSMDGRDRFFTHSPKSSNKEATAPQDDAASGYDSDGPS